jgi:hypothetical protein
MERDPHLILPVQVRLGEQRQQLVHEWVIRWQEVAARGVWQERGQGWWRRRQCRGREEDLHLQAFFAHSGCSSALRASVQVGRLQT